MKDRQEFPNFQDFVFMLMEAEIACNLLTLLHALHSPESNSEKHYLRERKPKSSVLHTQTVTETETQGQLKTDLKPSCMLCQDSKYRLHAVLSSKGNLWMNDENMGKKRESGMVASSQAIMQKTAITTLIWQL